MTRGEEERRCAFGDVRAHTAHTADCNVTLSPEVPDDSERGTGVRALPLMKHASVCVPRGRKVSSLSAKISRARARILRLLFTSDFVGVAKEATLAEVPINSIAVNRQPRLFLGEYFLRRVLA